MSCVCVCTFEMSFLGVGFHNAEPHNYVDSLYVLCVYTFEMSSLGVGFHNAEPHNYVDCHSL